MKIYLVGGAVRDYLLNLPIKDRDWVVVGSTEKFLLSKKFQQVGKDFPVFLHPKTREEYALARKERKSGQGYTGFNTIYNSNVTLKEDLIRRDLTINAIAQDNLGNYIDPFQGRKDIESRLLRHVSKSFIEDPLRVLRTARIAAYLAHLGFTIAHDTMELMKSMVKKKELSYLTINRIWNETYKALKTLNPHVYFQVLYACKALFFLFPEIYNIYEKKIFVDFYKFKKINNNFSVLMGLSKISVLTEDVSIRFSYLCQFLSRHTVFSALVKKFYDSSSALIVKNLCMRLNVPSYMKNMAILSNGFFCFLNTINYQSSKDIVIFFSKIDAWRKPERINALAFLSDFNFSNYFKSNTSLCSPGFFLKKIYDIAQKVSIKSVLNQGLKGYEIKNKLMFLRINKIELWRIKNIKKYSY